MIAVPYSHAQDPGISIIQAAIRIAVVKPKVAHILIRSLRPGLRAALAGGAWGLCPLARRKGPLALDRDGIPSLPRGRVFLTLANSFDPLVQAG
ncbi:hypothetical protein [Xanthobacter pseudotagetidis]|uniref:hypothetical protein n=1 Tax=Xanthobacter pseudotagetidis TaxID=3119911 RepID=UPI00372736EF